MACNSFWTDEEKAMVDQAVKGEITADQLAAMLPHRSAKGIGKQLARRARVLGKPAQKYDRAASSSGLAPDDPGFNDNWERINSTRAALGSAKLLMAIGRVYPDRVSAC